MTKQDTYYSKPNVEIRAFQYTGNDVTPPEWLREPYHSGMITICTKKNYITVYKDGGRTEFQRGYLGDWICFTKNGNLFIMGKSGFQALYGKD